MKDKNNKVLILFLLVVVMGFLYKNFYQKKEQNVGDINTSTNAIQIEPSANQQNININGRNINIAIDSSK